MTHPEIVDEEQVRRWFAEGRTYQFMVDTYERVYGKTVSASVFGEFRRANGVERGTAWPGTSRSWQC